MSSNSIIPLQLGQIRNAIQQQGRNSVSVADYTNVVRQNQSLQINLANMTANRDEYAAGVDRLERNLDDVYNRVAEYEAATQRREAAWKELSKKQVREYNGLVDEYNALQAEFNDVARKHNALLDKNKTLRTEKAALEQKNAALQAELDALKKSQSV
jgi:predicted nuclease with TOPRIM domain